jgi:hypothetical protein
MFHVTNRFILCATSTICFLTHNIMLLSRLELGGSISSVHIVTAEATKPDFSISDSIKECR